MKFSHLFPKKQEEVEILILRVDLIHYTPTKYQEKHKTIIQVPFIFTLVTDKIENYCTELKYSMTEYCKSDHKYLIYQLPRWQLLTDELKGWLYHMNSLGVIRVMPDEGSGSHLCKNPQMTMEELEMPRETPKEKRWVIIRDEETCGKSPSSNRGTFKLYETEDIAIATAERYT